MVVRTGGSSSLLSLFIYLLLAVWSLLSSCGSWGLLSRCGVQASHCWGFSRCGAQALGVQASVVSAPRLCSAGSAVVVDGLSCSAARGILLQEGSNPSLLHWQVGFFSTEPPGGPPSSLLGLTCHGVPRPVFLNHHFV